MTLSKVFEPIHIGDLEVPNRIVAAAHGTGFSSPRDLIGGEDFIAHHVALARGGVGLTVLEATAVHPSSQAMTRSDDRVVGRYEEIMKSIRPYGTRVFQQVFHPGSLLANPGGEVPWAVSSVPSLIGQVGVPITIEQIEELTAAFAAAAVRCRDGGLDGVELHASHGTLPPAFLSPLYNTRTDEYGGTLENRMRFLLGIMRAMRSSRRRRFLRRDSRRCQRDAGKHQRGRTPSCRRGTAERGADRFPVHVAWATSSAAPRSPGGMEYQPGYQLPSTSQLTAAATVPSIVAGRFRTLEEAEQVLCRRRRRHGHDGPGADRRSGRRRKTREGRAQEIRPCIACNQGCKGGGALRRANDVLGEPRRRVRAQLSRRIRSRPSSDPRRVLVVGGGPGGLEAARVAALRGHTVKLVEASSRLGGALDAARRAPRFALLGDIVDWLGGAVERAGVEVVLDTPLSADDIRAEAADDRHHRDGIRAPARRLPAGSAVRARPRRRPAARAVVEGTDDRRAPGGREDRTRARHRGPLRGDQRRRVPRRPGTRRHVRHESPQFRQSRGARHLP